MSNKTKLGLVIIIAFILVIIIALLLAKDKTNYEDYLNEVDPIQQSAIDNAPYVNVTDSTEELPKEVEDLIVQIKNDNNYTATAEILETAYDEEENKMFYTIRYGDKLWYIYRLMSDGTIYSYPDPHN